MNLNITLEDLHWLAGIVEGEGCYDTKQKYYPRVQVRMADRDVMERVQRIVNQVLGTAYELTIINPRGLTKKVLYGLQLTGYAARDLMNLLQPLMGERRSVRIQEALTAFATRPNPQKRPMYQRVKSLIASTQNKRFTLKQVVDGQQPTPLLHSSLSSSGTSSAPTPDTVGSNSTGTKSSCD